MILKETDIEWLESRFPSLTYQPDNQKIVGELNFCACYDKSTGKVKIEDLCTDPDIRNSDNFICDVFEIEIHLDDEYLGRLNKPNGWPKVYEVGGRNEIIAQKCDTELIDLHFFDNNKCCLGIRLSRERNLDIKRFIHELVIPFFYRLSYTDRFGLESARTNLWGEYSHGDEGNREHWEYILNIDKNNRGRNKPCPCGSNIKYKWCCLDEVNAASSLWKDGRDIPGFKSSRT